MPLDKPGLRRALRQRSAWLDHHDLGPAAVDAGECDRCGAEAPVDLDLWTECYRLRLHERGGGRDLGLAGAVPAEADDVARLWWAATGEVRLDPAGALTLATRLRLPAGEVAD
ncbi:MAG: hypothetical protein M3387_13335 [Actinomycetota bacterium]|nr:hypothetical protein [Actinomycetota bacterium]